MTERRTAHGPGPDTKGGGFRGGPKRWTGGGPAPARHIPWPEIFKHHISVVEGHLKMIDMVRKHTVEGSGNYRTIMGCVDRAKEMLQVSKQISRTFVPPSNHREQVPLGSSSASMYPGYSPADHEYGKAAEEYGKAAAEARAKGIELKHPDAEYVIGQAKGVKRSTLAGIREAQAAKGKASGSGGGSGSGRGSGSEGPMKQEPRKSATANGKASTEKVQEATLEGDNPYFIIDTKPTPVDIPGMSSQSLKRSASPPEAVEAKKHKKAKNTHDGDIPRGEDTQEAKTEDISDQVDARMKEKEKKRKMKEEKKRKRESEDEPAVGSEDFQPAVEASATAAEAESPKKKKAKQTEEEALPDRTASKKRLGEDKGEAEDGEGKKKKKRKKSKDSATASDG